MGEKEGKKAEGPMLWGRGRRTGMFGIVVVVAVMPAGPSLEPAAESP